MIERFYLLIAGFVLMGFLDNEMVVALIGLSLVCVATGKSMYEIYKKRK